MISIIIPHNNLYKRLKTVTKSIKMIPSNINVEYIFIGHSYDDDSNERIQELARSCDDKKIVNISFDENEKISTLVNQGIQRAKGDYITFILPGDEIYPDNFAKMVNFINSKQIKAEIFLSSFSLFDSFLGQPTTANYFYLDTLTKSCYLNNETLNKLSCSSERTWVSKKIAMKCMFNENTAYTEFSTIPLWYGMANKIYFKDIKTYKKLISEKERRESEDDMEFFFIQSKKAIEFIIEFYSHHPDYVKNLSYAKYLASKVLRYIIKGELRGKFPQGYTNAILELVKRMEKLESGGNYKINIYKEWRQSLKIRVLRLCRPILKLIYYFKKDKKESMFS